VRLKHSYPVIALCVFALVSSMGAQEAVTPRHTGVPQDWSTHHIVFSRDGLLQHPEILYREPRVLHQVMQRWQAPNSDVFRGVSQASGLNNSSDHRDWNFPLVKGKVSPNMYPAKYSFDPTLPPSCANDYAVFGITAVGNVGTGGGQANLIGFNNLYSGPGPGLCGSGGPSVFFAYNTTTVAGGKIVTSPVISEDGTKIAFVESVPGTTPQAIFHVLTWTANQGTITAAAVPTMTSATFSPTSDCTTSSPWVDYSADIAYVGSDNGILYKITNVFKGTPAVDNTFPWPVLVSKNNRLSPPVQDSSRSILMVGSGNGSLYQIKTNTGAATPYPIGKAGAKSAGVLTAPAVDVSNGTTFAVSANDGNSAVLVEVDTCCFSNPVKVRIGIGAASGTAMSINEPAFDNQYFTDPNTGHIRLCGNNPNLALLDTSPWQYSFGFSAGRMNPATSSSQQLLTSTAAQCTGWTEFFNPNINGGTDFFFFGLTQDCAGPATSGCVVEQIGTSTVARAPVNGGPSGIIVDNYSTAAQAHSIYLTAEKANTAYKFTQNGLQ
jgi:hypothetical protein